MSGENNHLKIFAGRHSVELANRICAHLKFPLGKARIDAFPDGEIIVKLDEDVRGRDCFVVCSTCPPVNDNLMELLIYIDCLRRASAKRVTVVVPYFGYARQDRKDEGRVPITAKLVANLMVGAGCDRVLALELHSAQIQGFFDIPVDHLTAAPVFYEYFSSIREELGDLCLVSPDVGNVKVAEEFANLLGGELAIINKRRNSGDEVVVDRIIGDVAGKTVLMVDDMVSTAGTICQAAELVRESGAKRVLAAATHGLFVGRAVEKLNASPISQIVVTNSVPAAHRRNGLKVECVELCIGSLLGEAISRIHHDQSVSALFRKLGLIKR